MNSANLKDTYQKLSDCFRNIQVRVSVCAAKAINTAMSESDPDWFVKFKEQELKFPESIALVRYDQKELTEADFQAIIKAFRYRENADDLPKNIILKDPVTVEPVFNKYGLPRKHNGKSKFSAMIDNLIAARNEVAHLSTKLAEAGYLEAADDELLKKAILANRKAIIEFITFLSYFPSVTDSAELSYYDSALALRDQTERELGIATYSVSDIISDYGLKVSVQEFSELCAKLYITTHIIKGQYYFETSDIDDTIRILGAIIEARPKKKSPLMAIVAIVIAVLAISLLLIIILPKLLGDSDNQNSSQFSSLSAVTSQEGGDSSDYTSSQESSDPASSSEPSPSSNSTPSSDIPSSKYDPPSSVICDHFINTDIEGRYTPNNVTVVAKEVYWEGNTLVAHCYIVNAYNYQINRTHVSYIKISNGNGTVIAEGNFNTSQNLTIDGMSYVEHTFTFRDAAIVNRNVDMSVLRVYAKSDYYH